MHDVSHNHWLIVASLLVVLMAGFTGLSLLRGASKLGTAARKRTIIMAAVAMGTGIWSMHFVAMLGMELGVPFFYDALITMASALIAILVMGVSLILLHFFERTFKLKFIAGICVGTGILAMHYLGMHGIRLVRPDYSVMGVALAIFISIALSVGMVFAAYRKRQNSNILAGTVIFGTTVFLVHFAAMVGTDLMPTEDPAAPQILISNDILAFGVALTSFIISGAFLLMSVSLLPQGLDQQSVMAAAETNDQPDDNAPLRPVANRTLVDEDQSASIQIPFESHNRTGFLEIDDVAAIRAEGHYSILYSPDNKHFCPWNISEVKNRLSHHGFLQTHRSYLVNPNHVTGFERKKDNGICFFENCKSLEKVPVSRSKLSETRAALGLSL